MINGNVDRNQLIQNRLRERLLGGYPVSMDQLHSRNITTSSPIIKDRGAPEKYVCRYPFVNLNYSYSPRVCCNFGDELMKSIDHIHSLEDIINHPHYKEFRLDLLHGDYSKCPDNCPHKATGTNKQFDEYPFISVTELAGMYDKTIDKLVLSDGTFTEINRHIQLGYDKTCNLSCPACRPHVINENSNEWSFNRYYEKLLNVANKVRSIEITNSGDAFASTHFRTILETMEEKTFPALEEITIHTNGVLFTPRMWDRLSPFVKEKIKCILISIDAGTQEDYDKIRVGGDFFKVLENIHFLANKNIPIWLNYILQVDNYESLLTLVDLMKDYETVKIKVAKVNDWGSMSSDKYNQINVWDSNHNEYVKCKDIIDSLKDNEKVSLNLPLI